MKARRFAAYAVVFVLVMTWVKVDLLMGQAATGTITGIVMDSSRAVIPGADVTLKSEATGDLRRTITNDEGFFSIAAVPARVYSLFVEVSGFARWERTGISMHSGDKIHIHDLLLRVASTTEQVTVSATPDVMIPVNSGEKASVITAKQIQNLSIVGRSAVELLKILPGVVYTGAGFPGEVVQFNQGIGNYSVGGMRDTAISIVSDGADVIDPGCDCGSAVTPNVEMIQEVKVQTANFSAEHAKGPVVVNAVSKSGTSDFHGEGYVYWRRPRFNSQDWKANRFGAAKPRDTFAFPGFNIGGPLIIPGTDFNKKRDKLFFFAGFEWMRQNIDLGVRQATVPTAKMRLGDFSELADGMKLNGYDAESVPTGSGISNRGVISPSLIDKGGQILLNLYPLPNRDPAKNNGFNFVSNLINPQHRNQQLVRVDYNISENTKLYTRFNHEYQSSPYPYTLWWFNSNDVPYPSKLQGDYTTWSSSTSLAKVFDPSTTNELVFAATYWRMPHALVDPEKVSVKALGYPYKGIFKNNTDIIPNITDWGGGVADLVQPGGLKDPTVFGHKLLFSLEDNFSKVIDTHTLKFGAFFQLTTNDEPTTSFDQGMIEATNWVDNSSGNAYADLLMGRVGGYAESTKNIVGYIRRREWSFYAQDNWKASRRMTIEYGARFYHPSFNYDTNGLLAGFDAAKYDPKAPIEKYSGIVAKYRGDNVPRSIWKSPTLIVAPRFGFAYDLSGKGNSVVRGGVGKYVYHGRGGDSFGAVGNPPLQRSVTICCGTTLAALDQIDPDKNVQKSNLLVLEPNNDKVPETYSWSFTISQRMPLRTVVETSYVGNVSHHQLTPGGQNINLVPEGAMFGRPKGNDPNNYRPFQSYGTIAMKRHSLSQNYHSLQVTANRQAGRFNFSTAYTFSKAMGVGGGSFSGRNVDYFDYRRRSYGPLSYDRTHGLSIAYNYLVPDVVKTPGLREIVNGWQFSGITQFQSGAPLSTLAIQVSGTMADGTSMSAINVNGTPDTPARLFVTCDPREGLAENQYANPSCFAAPSVGKNGHYQYPYMKGPGFQNHDISVFKNFVVKEDQKLQVRVSAYNFLNHPINTFVGGDPGLSLQFDRGVLTKNSLDRFGRTTNKQGRRLMQFAVKYMF